MSWIEEAVEATKKTGWDSDLSSDKPKCPSRFLRFWMPKGANTKLVFLTDEPRVVIWEHQIKLRDDYRNWATCLRHLKIDCPLCQVTHPNIKTYRVGMFTVIDRTVYTIKKGDRAGEEVKDQKRLLAVKGVSWEILALRAKKRHEKGESLRGAQFDVTRGKGEKSHNIGDDFEFDCMADLAEFKDTTELDYETLLKPDPELVKAYLLSLNALGDYTEAANDDTDETVQRLPF